MSMQSVASPAISVHPAQAQFADPHSRRRGLADHRQDARGARRPQGTGRADGAPNTGLVYRSHIFGETSLTLLGPEANELVLFDQAKLFSSTHGWGRILGLLFPRGLMLLDFDEHRLHRRALSVAFKSGPDEILSRGARYRHRGAGRAVEGAAGADAVLSGDEAAHARPRRDLVPRRRHRARGRRDHARLRRHGGRLDLRDPQTAARHQDGARRPRPRTHRRLFLGTDSDPPRQGRRRRPVLAAVPRDP